MMSLLRNIILFAFALSAVSAQAATYYACNNATTCNAASSGWATGSNANACTTKGAPCNTITGAYGKMAAGDTLIVGNGSYSEDLSPPYGSVAAGYTTTKAENMGGVSVPGPGSMNFGSGYRAYYLQFDGLLFTSAVLVNYGHHVKFIRVGSSDGGSGNSANFMVGESGDYVLFEECYAFGNGRYKFLAWHGDNIVMRRNVARMDALLNADGQNPAGFAMYSMSNGVMQNNIVIDSDTESYWSNYTGPSGCYYVPDTSASTINITIDSNVCLKSQLGGIQSDGHEGSFTTYVTAKNNVVWAANMPGNDQWVNLSRGTNPVWSNNTFGVSNTGLAYLSLYSSTGASVTNNLFYGLSIPVQNYFSSGTHDYNTYYASSSGLPALSSHEYTNRNPIWNASTNPTGALKYITRIEAGSNHDNAGSGGADIGANLVYMVGASGTMFGETGYDVVQSTPMWPFPNEDVIKAKMSTYSYSSLSGARGFAASGTGLYGGPITLTSYIWEYLGNPCPTGICEGEPESPPALSAIGPASALASNATTASLSIATDVAANCRYSCTPNSADTPWASMTPFSATGTTAHASSLPVQPGQVIACGYVCAGATSGLQSDRSYARFSVAPVKKHRLH